MMLCASYTSIKKTSREIRKETCISMLIAALFNTITKTWKQTNSPSTDEWIKMWWVCMCVHIYIMHIYNIQFSSVTQSCPTLCDPMNCSTPGLPVHHQLLEFIKLTSIELVMPSSHLILGRPLLLLPSIPSSIRVFSNESTLRMRWPKYWSFSFSIISSKECPGLISFRMDWLDLLAVQYYSAIKKWNNAIWSNINEARDYQDYILCEVSQRERKTNIIWNHLYV